LENGALNTGTPALVGADAETADGHQPPGGGDGGGVELGARADAEHVHVLQRRRQLVTLQRVAQRGDVVVAGLAEVVHGGRMHALQQQDPDLVAVERSLAHGIASMVWKGAYRSRRIRFHGEKCPSWQ
jgi:hypothetical protein